MAIDTPDNDAPTVTIDGAFGEIDPAVAVSGGIQSTDGSSVASNGDGYVVVWSTRSPAFGSDAEIVGRRFTEAGASVGPIFNINSTHSGDQTRASVTQTADGGFVVSWLSRSTGTNDYAVYFQRYDAAGAKLGGEVPVVTTSGVTLANPAIANLDSGGFVLVWSREDPGTHDRDVYFRQFDSSGTALAPAAVANTTTAGGQQDPAVGGLDGGGFVVTWNDSASGDVIGQRFDAVGGKVGGEIPVTADGFDSSVTGLLGGGFAVVWTALNPGMSVDGFRAFNVFVRTYDAAGNPEGVAQLVNTTTDVHQFPGVEALTDGGFVVSWTHGPGGDRAVFTRAYDADGNAVTDQVPADADYSAIHSGSDVAGLADGGFAVTFIGSSSAVLAQRFGEHIDATEQIAHDLKGAIHVDDVDAGTGDISVTVSVDFGILDVAAGTSGATVSGSGTDTVTMSGTVAEIQALLDTDAGSSITYTANSDAPPELAELTVTVDDNGNTATTPPGPGMPQTASATVLIDIERVNDAPVRTGDSEVYMQPRFTDQSPPTEQFAGGFPVEFADPDQTGPGSRIVGLAVVGGSGNANGRWEWNDDFHQWNPFPDTSETSAYLVVFTQLRWNGSEPASTLLVRAVDDSRPFFGASGHVVDVTAEGTGGSSRFSADVVGINQPFLERPTPHPDNFQTQEDGTVSGNVLADNGSGADSGDGQPFTVTNVNGSAANVGVQITLASGALLTVNADGTFQYDPNGAFDATPTSASGAANTPAQDQFRYGISGGVTAGIVTIAILGVDSDDLVIGTAGSDILNAGIGNDTVNAAAGNDSVNGGSGNDVIDAGAGNDSVNGGSDNDVIDGGAGVDAMAGGAGDDLFFVDNGSDTASELAGEGRDKVYASAGFTLGNNVEDLALTIFAGVANGIGNGVANVLTGNDSANILYGLADADVLIGNGGNDGLDGGTGADNMRGGLGDDYYLVDNAGDVVVELAGQGRDKVYADFGYTLGANFEDLTLQAVAGAASGTGNTLNNVLTGNAFANTLSGLDGADVLIGGDGDDSLQGGTGADIMDGGSGNDGLNGGAGVDDMRGGLGDDLYVVDAATDKVTELTGQGRDKVVASVGFALGANVEDLMLETAAGAANGAGNALANVLTGNDSANSLNGAAGADVLIGNGGNDVLLGGTGDDAMTGGLGDDIYYADTGADSVTELAGQGRDKVYADLAYTLGANVEDLTLQAAASGSAGTGNGLANVLTGNGFNNILRGLDGDDVLVGNAGTDTLHGGLGRDTLQGGADADTFWFTTTLGGGNVDRILDFQVGVDEIILENSVFSGLAAGPLAVNAFNTGSAATDADDRIIYNSATGALLFDSDGTGAAAAVQFATLQTGLALSASDFTVI